MRPERTEIPPNQLEEEKGARGASTREPCSPLGAAAAVAEEGNGPVAVENDAYDSHAEPLPTRFIDSALPTLVEYQDSLSLSRHERAAVEEAAVASRQTPRHLKQSSTATIKGSEGVAANPSTTYKHSRDTLTAYGHEIARLRRELSQVREDWINSVCELTRIEGKAESLEEEQVEHRLRREMDRMEAKSRGCLSGSESSTFTDSAVSRAKLMQWSQSLNARSCHDKLLTLQHELRFLEATNHLLKLDEQGMLAEKDGEEHCIKRVTNPNCDLTMGDLETDDLEPRQDELVVWADPTLIAESLFTINVPREPRFKATSMELTLEDDQGHQGVVNAIVDSGAAWSAIDAGLLQRLFPTLQLADGDRKFMDASGNLMNTSGKATLHFWVGDAKLLTTVYVFKGLGAQFLLGVNSLKQNQISISTQRNVIFVESPLATAASSAPIQFAHAEPEGCSYCDEASVRTCECATRNKYELTCCTDSHMLTVRTPASVVEVPYEPSSVIDLPPAMQPSAAPEQYSSLLRTDREYRIDSTRASEIRLEFDKHCQGQATTLNVELTPKFREGLGAGLVAAGGMLHSSMNRTVPLIVNMKDPDNVIIIPRGTVVAIATKHTTKAHQQLEQVNLAQAEKLTFRTIEDPPAFPLEWMRVDTTPDAPVLINEAPLLDDRELQSPRLAARLLSSADPLSEDEWRQLCPQDMRKDSLRMSHYVKCHDGTLYCPRREKTFKEGGRPRTREDLHDLGFSLEKAIDPSGQVDAHGRYPPLSEADKDRLYGIALKWSCVWSRDAKTPELSRLVVIDIPTGDARPVAQRPYPVPFKYLDAVRKEVQKLLDGGLIEPCISNWASPILVRLKKDSTPDNIRLKIIVDYRRLNECTIPDQAGLGSQDEILHGFGGNQRYAGIVDAAGGFYQFLIKPSDRHKTAFVLPTIDNLISTHVTEYTATHLMRESRVAQVFGPCVCGAASTLWRPPVEIECRGEIECRCLGCMFVPLDQPTTRSL